MWEWFLVNLKSKAAMSTEQATFLSTVSLRIYWLPIEQAAPYNPES